MTMIYPEKVPQGKQGRLVVACEERDGLASAVSRHFGRSAYFAVIELEAEHATPGKIEFIANPLYDTHTPGAAPGFIKALGADVLIAGAIGQRAVDLLAHYGIKVFSSSNPATVQQALRAYLTDQLLQGSCGRGCS
jgi:predicted Fe-Mo cluster-binding NifX family protein